MARLQLRNLEKDYGSFRAVHGINLDVEDGEFMVLVGPSGCAKSTTLRMIAGLERVTGGEIRIGGELVNDKTPGDRGISMVFQNYALYPHMKVHKNLSFSMRLKRRPAAEIEQATSHVSSLLEIDPLLDRLPKQLSGGQAQRVAVGRALIKKPQVFLFDEPLSNLDAKLRVDMRTEIKRLHNRMKTTIVYVTHDQIEAMTLATKIAVLKDGVLQQFGTPAEIYNNPANMFVADFMGSPAMNLLTARIEKSGSDIAVTLTRPNAEPLKLAVPQANGALSAYAGKDVVFGIRPEALTDPDGADRNAKVVAEGECLIEVVEPAGSDTFAVTRLGGKEIVARLRADARIAPGQTSRLAFNLDKAVFFDPQSQQRIA
jgi:multiple sugar transport system ATP-binding protein